MKTTVFCTFRQIGFHQWPKAPRKSAYLRLLHRHEFHVRVDVFVTHNDRDVEFIDFKETCVSTFQSLGEFFEGKLSFGHQSCEHLANSLLESLITMGYAIAAIEVSEDGENGASLIL